jgi:chaperonin GroES
MHPAAGGGLRDERRRIDMKIRPLDDRVLIRPLESEETTEGGIVLPDTAKEKPQRGTVEAVGKGKLVKGGKRLESSLKKGDTVLFGKYSGSDIKVRGKEYKIMKESEILARFE